MKKIISVLAVCLVMCAAAAVPVSAAVPPDNGSIAAPCYEYTDNVSSSLQIYSSSASCTSNVNGIRGTTTKIVVTQTLQVKDGLSWRRVTDWSATFNTWYCRYSNTYNHSLPSGTYRVKTEAKVYKGTSYETVYAYSTAYTIGNVT